MEKNGYKIVYLSARAIGQVGYLILVQITCIQCIHTCTCMGCNLAYCGLVPTFVQAGYTKDFLRKIRRGKVSLPDGPLLLAPFSLYIAFRRYMYMYMHSIAATM